MFVRIICMCVYVYIYIHIRLHRYIYAFTSLLPDVVRLAGLALSRGAGNLCPARSCCRHFLGVFMCKRCCFNNFLYYFGGSFYIIIA